MRYRRLIFCCHYYIYTYKRLLFPNHNSINLLSGHTDSDYYWQDYYWLALILFHSQPTSSLATPYLLHSPFLFTSFTPCPLSLTFPWPVTSSLPSTLYTALYSSPFIASSFSRLSDWLQLLALQVYRFSPHYHSYTLQIKHVASL